MKAFEIQSKTAADSTAGELVLVEREKPSPAEGEVLIRVHACGLNRADIFQRKGSYPPPKGASDIPGLEVSGVIEVLGENVTQFTLGQRVCALLEGGGYAEYVAVSASQTLPIPNNLSDVEAAAIPEVFFTVWFNLFEKVKLQPDETLLVHGGSSGIGVAAIAMAKMLNIPCFVTTTHAEKVAKLKALGAKEVVLVTQQTSGEMVERVKALTDGKGVDVILDMVAGDYVAKNLEMLCYGGRLAVIALLGGAKSHVSLAPLLLKNLSITGATLRNQSRKIKAEIAAALYQNLWPLIKRCEYRPEIGRLFPVDEAPAAQAYMEQNHHVGKIVLQLR